MAGMGGLEAVLEAMRGHCKSAEVQEVGCGALRNLSLNADIGIKMVGMGGLEAVLEAMRGHPESTEVQEVGCGALRNLSFDEDNEIKIA
eukprot:2802133-Rhodomonas_salina.1